MRFRNFLLWLALSAPLAWAANVNMVTLSIDQKVPAPRWMYEDKVKVSGPELIQKMAAARKAQLNDDRVKCLAALDKTFSLGKSLRPWLTLAYLDCAQIRDKNGKASVSSLAKAVAKVDADPKWLVSGPAATSLRASYVEALLALAEGQMRTNRTGAWKTIDKLIQVKPWMAVDERANTYRWAGELAFIEQNLLAAQDFLTRSLNEKESSEIRTRVESIRSTLLKKKSAGAVPPVPLTPKTDDIGMSDEEREISVRMKRAYDSQDYVSAVEDGMALLQRFPGSRRSSEAADMVLDIYLSIANKTDDKFRNVRMSVVREMEKGDAARMARWANNAYARGNYLDALNLAEKAYEKYAGQVDGTKVLLLAGKAAVSAGEYDDAKADFEKLMRFHGGTPESAEAIFRLGLLEYRGKRYPQASTYFERVLALKSGDDFEYRSLYWQWRAQQKIDEKKARPIGEKLAAKYPFSYYGLRAQAELNGNTVKLENSTKPMKVELRFLESERMAWERMFILLKAGWFREADRELASLPDPQSNEELVAHAKLSGLAMRYDLAIQDISKVLENDPTLAQPWVLSLVFPEEYSSTIEKESKASQISPTWLRSLIRQESSFRPDVKSPANAQGLMQLLPSVGAELAKDLRIKSYQGVDSLMKPEINIKIGAYYLARLLKKFNGNMPLALAAYNAGPTRLRRWMQARKDLSPVEAANSSSPEVEVWLDELPWDETSFYVKSILRNWLVYQLLEGSKLTLNEPLWVDAKQASR